MMHETFISDVLMQSMLMLRSASAVNILAASPGVEAMREPTMAILATSVSISTRPAVLSFFHAGHQRLQRVEILELDDEGDAVACRAPAPPG